MATETKQFPAKRLTRVTPDRRVELRYKFGAVVELVESASDERREGRISDLCAQGCYVDMKPCFPIGTVATVRITKGAKTIEAQARVVFLQADNGMGVLFTSIPTIHIQTLNEWIAACRKSSWLAANRRRSQRILLQVPVRVSSSKGAAGPAFKEETRTTAISAHGALVLLSAPVKKGQPLILSNVRTGSSVECVVANIGEIEENRSRIGIAFVLPTSEFWPVNFPPEDWTSGHADAKQPTDHTATTSRPRR